MKIRHMVMVPLYTTDRQFTCCSQQIYQTVSFNMTFNHQSYLCSLDPSFDKVRSCSVSRSV